MKKNKLIINIVLVYFVLLAIVLAVQFKVSSGRAVSTEPLKGVSVYNDVLSSSIVMYDRSPVMLVKQKQMLVDEKNVACVPYIKGKSVYVPLSFFETAYGAVVSYDKNGKSATVRLDNKALVSDNAKNTVMLISASGENKLSDKSDIVFKNDNAYIPLEAFVNGFNKKLELHDGMIVLADTDIKLNDEDVDGFISTVKPQVKNFPSVDEKKKLEELLGTGAVSLFNGFGGGSAEQGVSAVSSLGLDSMSVDEPVQIKTDGNYIYTFDGAELQIYSAKDENELVGSVQTQLKTISGIYVGGNYVAAIGSGSAQRSDSAAFDGCVAELYDVTDRAKPELARTIAAEGDYLDAHKKDNMVYLFVRKSADTADASDMPSYYDSANEAIGAEKSLSTVRYVPEMADKAYTSVVSFCVNDISRAVKVYTILGCGNNFALTGDSFYIAAGSDAGTSVYRFELNDGELDYASVGYTEDNIPDNTCINEYDGVLRVATANEDSVSVILMDSKMDETDRLEDIAIDGRLAGARFIGGRGYLVSNGADTPIFAVDLSNKPTELGGINIADDVIAVRNFDAEHFICFKSDGSMSMLNIADMADQKETFVENTGGSIDIDKVLLKTDEALLFVPLSFEDGNVTEGNSTDTESVTELVSETETATEAETASETTTEAKAEPQFKVDNKWQGICVYSVDLENDAFKLKADVTHLTNGYSEDELVEAMTYADGKLYTVSPAGVRTDEITN